MVKNTLKWCQKLCYIVIKAIYVILNLVSQRYYCILLNTFLMDIKVLVICGALLNGLRRIHFETAVKGYKFALGFLLFVLQKYMFLLNSRELED